jgi:acyl-CoA thioester hydrolase
VTAAAPGPGFEHGLRVYWEDTDAGGVVFYANYLKFFERARTEWLRAHGHVQEPMRRDRGLMFVVAETQVQYRAPARLDDWLVVTVEVVEAGRASLVIAQRAFRVAGPNDAPTSVGRTLLAEGRIRIGCVDTLHLRPQRIPADLLDTFR